MKFRKYLLRTQWCHFCTMCRIRCDTKRDFIRHENGLLHRWHLLYNHCQVNHQFSRKCIGCKDCNIKCLKTTFKDHQMTDSHKKAVRTWRNLFLNRISDEDEGFSGLKEELEDDLLDPTYDLRSKIQDSDSNNRFAESNYDLRSKIQDNISQKRTRSRSRRFRKRGLRSRNERLAEERLADERLRLRVRAASEELRATKKTKDELDPFKKEPSYHLIDNVSSPPSRVTSLSRNLRKARMEDRDEAAWYDADLCRNTKRKPQDNDEDSYSHKRQRHLCTFDEEGSKLGVQDQDMKEKSKLGVQDQDIKKENSNLWEKDPVWKEKSSKLKETFMVLEEECSKLWKEYMILEEICFNTEEEDLLLENIAQNRGGKSSFERKKVLNLEV